MPKATKTTKKGATVPAPPAKAQLDLRSRKTSPAAEVRLPPTVPARTGSSLLFARGLPRTDKRA